jgi:ABC-type Mn2+/Zn2+ transport system permease subunit
VGRRLGGTAGPAGLAVAFLSGVVTRLTPLREDASFAAFYLISLSLGVLLVSIDGSNVDLLHLLFGSILAVDDAALILVGGIATASLLLAAVIYRPLVVECFDRGFLRAVGGRGGLVHTLFLALVVFNLVAGSQALGTLMAVGLMMLPAAARFWVRELWSLSAASSALALGSGFLGLLLFYNLHLPSGPAIVLFAGFSYLVSARSARATACARSMSGARISRLEPDTKKGRDRRASAQTCQVGPGLPMLPPPMTLVPFISQMAACPLVFCHRMSECPLP